MHDGLVFLSMIFGFASVIVVGAKLGAGSPASLTGLFASQAARDWPTGVQETDAPRFMLASPPTSPFPAVDLEATDLEADLLELYEGPIRG